MLIHQFDECWIPDYPDPVRNLSGKLSHRYKLPRNARYVGILSRFKSPQGFQGLAISDYYDVVFVLSGPEPQLGILFHICKTWADHAGKKTLIISGYHHKTCTCTTGNSHVRIVPHLDSGNFRQALVSAGVVICRSGYSAIMDLIALGRTAILIPTPGQTEQEYLADSLSKKGLFRYIKQHEMEDTRLCQYINDLQISNAIRFFPDQDEMSIPFLSNKEHC
jgi:predicted glycosyltransferase